MASTYLTRTNGTPTDLKIQTYSVWVKRSGLSSSTYRLFGGYDGSSGYSGEINFSSNQFRMEFGGSSLFEIKTNAVYRDTSAWYHLVVSIDTTQATASDRVKLYVNGEQITSLASSNYPSQNATSLIGISGRTFVVGGGWSGAEPFDGSMAHVHFIDGTAYDASYFGQADANGVWTIKTSPSVTYGNNGFFILKDGNSVTDQSGNGNNFTVASGTLTNTEDNPSNVFCTLNPLISIGNDAGNQQVLSNGNLHVTGNQPSWCHSRGTFGASSGKWYWEVKVNGSTMGYLNIGVSNAGTNMYGGTVQSLSGNTSIYGDGQYNINGTITGAQSPTFSAGDICGVALNMDSNTVSFYKNGTILSWGTNLSISGGTDDVWLPASAVYNTSQSLDFNFGNGYFGTTAVSSAGTNASGIGIFEYDVPTGYTALSTKGLNL